VTQPSSKRLLRESQAATAADDTPLAPGTASAGSSSQFAKEDHVHPAAGLYMHFGDGHHGDLLLDGVNDVTGFSRSGTVYQATEQIMADDLTILTGVTMRPRGHAICVRGVLSGAGTIQASPGRVSLGGSSNFPNLLPGGTGPAGTTGAGAAGVVANNTSGSPGTSGSGGASGATAGGVGGASNSSFVSNGAWLRRLRMVPTCFTGFFHFTDWGNATPSFTGHMLGGACSGGAGAGDGTNLGGKGGDGGQGIIINARRITGTLTISAPGEAGGAAAGGNAGGGGGGTGGWVVLNTTDTTGWTGSLSAPGGAGGAKAGTGIAGGAGAAGVTQTNVW
jgi:hypothetical protein